MTVMLGVAISTMVLTGTLIIGDSVVTSLESATQLRLGKSEFLFSGIDRYFRISLADDIRNDIDADVAPILQLKGIGSSQGGKYKLNGIQVLGIDKHFSSLIPSSDPSFFPPSGNQAYISENLSRRLQLNPGDAFVLRIENASQIPKNAPFVSEADQYISLRLTVGKIMSPDQLGRFNLKTSQTAPLNVFLSLPYLNKRLNLKEKANRLLFSGSDDNTITKALDDQWSLADMALEIFPANEGKDWEIRSERVFIDSSILKSVKIIDDQAQPILTYMINAFRSGNSETPYSFISAGPFLSKGSVKDEININDWMAEDLELDVGDSIECTYYVIGPLRNLTELTRRFMVAAIVPIEGIHADRDLMPQLPGLTDAGNCREWEAGVPVDLDKIRDKDEDYWKIYRGTPKAFISYETGKELWENRFGSCTSIRLSADDLSKTLLESQLSKLLEPTTLGFSLQPIREEGFTAARGGVDFSQLFMGLSFFLLVAGLILTTLLFNLHLERRFVEIGTLKALGIRQLNIKLLLLVEGVIIAFPAVLLGGLLAILYNKLVFHALNTVWFDIVRTSILQEDVHWRSMVSGMTITMVLIIIIIWFSVTKKLRSQSSELQQKVRTMKTYNGNKVWSFVGWISALIAIALLLKELVLAKTLNSEVFFISGSLFLLGFMAFIAAWFGKIRRDDHEYFSQEQLIKRNLIRNRARSLRVVILFALGTFVVISTGLNRKDLHGSANQPTSGTGGFLLYMETTLPILKNLNNSQIKGQLSIDHSLNFVQLRKNEGDDASCLNLNRVTSPRILGVPSEKLEGRFSFIKHTRDLDPEYPWTSLQSRLGNSVVPAFVDQTVLQWGLGKKVGDTLIYLDEFGMQMKIKVIGGLANSIFQGNVLIDENIFLEHFPSNSGTHVFLVDGPQSDHDQAVESLTRSFRNEGLEITSAADRLATFNQVENTYLSIFMLLGGLAMILGTFGLGIILIRNIMDRAKEIGILYAIGYTRKIILQIIAREHMILLIAGALSGAIAAFLAVVPSLLSEFIEASWEMASLLIGLILLNGIFWIYVLTKRTLSENLFEVLRKE